MSPLTDRQAAILAFIRAHTDGEGVPPTLQEIASAFGFRQACAAHKHVRRLEQAGYLGVRPNAARGIRLSALGLARTDPAADPANPPAAAPADTPAVTPPPRSRTRDDRLSLPVLGRVAAGSPIGADAGVQRHLQLDRALFSTRPDYLLRVQGDSMRDDGILHGDLVAVKRGSDARDGQTVVARIEGELTIKRLQRTPDAIRLLPRNPDYAPIEVPAGADFAIEGLYCGLVRPE